MVARATDGGDNAAQSGSETHPVVRLGFRPDGKRRVSVASGSAPLPTAGEGASGRDSARGVGSLGGAVLGGSASAALSRQASGLNLSSSSLASYPSSAFPAPFPLSNAPRSTAFARPPARAAPGAGRGLAGRLLVRAFFDDMKTVSMQRINQKNAFQVDLIDRLALVVQQQLVKTDHAALTDGNDAQQPALLDGASSPDFQSNLDMSRTGRGEEGEEGITFTHVSSAVEGATRVYGYRVEAVYDQTYHVLNLMSASRQGQGGEDEADGEAASHPARRGRHRPQLLLFKKGGASTLAPASEITEAQIDKDSCVDPYFLKISGMFDQAGAKGLLLANLEVDTSLRMKLDGECRAFPTGVLTHDADREKGEGAREETQEGETPERTMKIPEPSVDCAFLKDLLLAGDTPASVLSLDICEKPIGHFRSLLQSLRRGRDAKAAGAVSEVEDEANELEADDEALDMDMDAKLGDSVFPDTSQDEAHLLRVGESYMSDDAAACLDGAASEAREGETPEAPQDDELFGDGGMDFLCDGPAGDPEESRDEAWERQGRDGRVRDGDGGDEESERFMYDEQTDGAGGSSGAHAKSYSFDRLVPAFSQFLGVPGGGQGAQLAAKRAFGLVPTTARPQGSSRADGPQSLGGESDGGDPGSQRGGGAESASAASDTFPLLARGSGAAVPRGPAVAARLTAKERQMKKQEQFREMLNPFRVDMTNLDTKSAGLPLGSKFQCYVPRPQENVTVASDFTSSPFLHSPHLLVSLAMVPFKEIRLRRHTGPSLSDGWAPGEGDTHSGQAGRQFGRGDRRGSNGPWEATFIDAGDDAGLGDDSFWSGAAHGPLLKERALEAADAKAQTLLEGGGVLDNDWADTAWAGGENDQASSYIARLFERGDAASRGTTGLSLGDIVGVSELRLSIPSRYVDVAVVKKALKTALGVLPDSADRDAESSARSRKRKRDVLTTPGEEQSDEEDDADSCVDGGESGESCRELALWSPHGRRDGVDFEALCTETTKKLPCAEKANCSPQMLFVCLLYTCNEETLHLERSPDFSSFSAFVHAPTDWHTRDDAEAVRILETVRNYSPLALPALPEKKKKETLGLEGPAGEARGEAGGVEGEEGSGEGERLARKRNLNEERNEGGNKRGQGDDEVRSKKRRNKRLRKIDSDESSD
ncbi:ccaat-box DNA binding protein subunit B, related [Neospora caninum Liverpool]|uniref:Condensin complex subunit 2 n=1 Tax=Neospora caninum (strain Liverpool) TaxID=572307 RepID=F0VBS3_NEOCL|nr:ccaat-box DNA binding protein subunit B, related [Neospora caninum Liverpool]CBZ51057.1 ccaat-box DNA binding protein subunit B, related [Neospora caninum Liverpool]CEL68363.1 TPA: CCAAT-box DNA binding protein subunit B, related [Neospora caninum Liverpool]|eukprot:XP_003881090.1 ccaat-box DNA binding protein subunit B, related [Neospora caninum Liverpool]